jgi:hypothetical protein
MITTLALLADDSGGGEAKKAGPIALVVILLLCVACYFLFRSMTRHLRKVREQFPVDDAEPTERPAHDPTAPPTMPNGNGVSKPPST